MQAKQLIHQYHGQHRSLEISSEAAFQSFNDAECPHGLPGVGKGRAGRWRMRELDLKQGWAQKIIEIQSKKKTAQRTARTPCAASLAASHVHSSRAAPAAGTPLAHTRLQGMLTGAPVLCIWGVILDLTNQVKIYSPGVHRAVRGRAVLPG